MRDTTGELSTSYRDCMRALVSGVTMVTSEVDGRPWGLTISAFCSISAEPPTVMISLGTRTVSARSVAAAGRFGVSVLSARQRDVAEFGAAPGRPKFLDTTTFPLVQRAADRWAVAGALAHLDCDVEDTVVRHDHTVFWGRVVAAHDASEDRGMILPPLTYYASDYHVLGASL